jgi:CotH kinase protein
MAKLLRLGISLLFYVCTLCTVQAQDFYSSGVREVRIEMKQPRWEKKLDSLKTHNPEARLAGTIWVDGQRFDSVGIRFKGNSSYFRTRNDTYRKLPFNIRLDYKVKTQKLRDGQTTIRLSNAFLDPSFLRDPLSYDVVRRYMPAPLCNFTKLYINNTFFGLYVNTESIDNAFLKKHFGVDKLGYLVKCDPDSWSRVRSQSGCPKGENASLVYLNDSPGCYDAFYEVDNTAAWKPMLTLIKTLNKQPENIESVLDVDQTLWMLALNNALVNLDSYTGSLSHNYYLWFDTTNVAHPLMWDFNMSFGGWRRNQSFEEMKDEDLIQYTPLAEINNPKRPLISQLLKQGLYRKLYLAHLRTIVTEMLQTNAWYSKGMAMSREIEPWVKQDSLKLYRFETFQQSFDKTMTSGPDHVIGLRQLMDQRTAFLTKHPLLIKNQPKIAEARHTKQGDNVLITAKLTDATVSAWVYTRTERWQAFKKQPLRDDGQNGDTTAGDGVFSSLIPAKSIKHYYIVAENAEAAATYPERASYEFLKVE